MLILNLGFTNMVVIYATFKNILITSFFSLVRRKEKRQVKKKSPLALPPTVLKPGWLNMVRAFSPTSFPSLCVKVVLLCSLQR